MEKLSQWKGIQWSIQIDIKGFFDKIDHHMLQNILIKKIDDQQFIDLFWKSIKAGYLEEGVKRDSLLGLAEGK